jgi:hypothetical protein
MVMRDDQSIEVREILVTVVIKTCLAYTRRLVILSHADRSRIAQSFSLLRSFKLRIYTPKRNITITFANFERYPHSPFPDGLIRLAG